MDDNALEILFITVSSAALLIAVFGLLSERKRLKRINTWATDLRSGVEARIEIMAAHEKLTRVYRAHQSGNISEMMIALDMDVNDPLYTDLSLSEFDGIVAVRVADLKRMIIDKGL